MTKDTAQKAGDLLQDIYSLGNELNRLEKNPIKGFHDHCGISDELHDDLNGMDAKVHKYKVGLIKSKLSQKEKELKNLK
jgi:hypothetical protein